ncbi:ATP-binding protein [Marinomonas rhodophyticola]|uniref:histidine kinase n=1 Tax=Marinomonas rhodophyticola TaxID=2992803 RepID=A0ABT3KD60_9GAMM|nr:ATP-binding protein [Marinomonas sp. KJ51-3]MCW4628052.1 ATP-binding protein [Marinomonas sp. KJ51-3]
MFRQFFRVENSRNRATGGRGLGLAICSNIVDGHQGTISAYHSPAGGLGIRIEFPLN